MTDHLISGLMDGDATVIARINAYVAVYIRKHYPARYFPSVEDLALFALAEAIPDIISKAILDDAQLLERIRQGVTHASEDVKRHAPPLLPIDGADQQTSYEPDKVGIVYHDKRSPAQERQTRIDLIAADDQLIKFLALHPDRLHTLPPRRFERVVAEILDDLGYSVELTALGADGGVDIIATHKDTVGDALLLVDCKRYAPDHPVGVSIVRAMLGIMDVRRATAGLIVTTSRFTAPAQDFRDTVRHRLSLKEYDDILLWLRQYGRGSVRR